MDRSTANRWVMGMFAVTGLLLIVIGMSLSYLAANSDTAVPEFTARGTETRVHNIGLIGRQQAETTFYAAMAIVGSVLFIGAWIASGLEEMISDNRNRWAKADEWVSMPVLPPLR